MNTERTKTLTESEKSVRLPWVFQKLLLKKKFVIVLALLFSSFCNFAQGQMGQKLFGNQARSWSLTRAPDHLAGLGWADEILATHTPYYKDNRIVWAKDLSGNIVTKPLAVAINSQVTLEAHLPIVPKGEPFIEYKWYSAPLVIAEGRNPRICRMS